MIKSVRLITAATAAAFIASAAYAGTVDDVKRKGHVQCGVSQGLPGFSNPDEKGNWTGIDVDVCRAVAAAVLGSADKVKYTPLSAKERFTALHGPKKIPERDDQDKKEQRPFREKVFYF